MGKLCLRANNKDGVSLCYTYIDVVNYKFIYIYIYIMVSHTGSQSQLQQGPPDPPKGVAALTNLFSNGCARISNRTQGARALGSLSLIPSVHPSVYP